MRGTRRKQRLRGEGWIGMREEERQGAERVRKRKVLLTSYGCKALLPPYVVWP